MTFAPAKFEIATSNSLGEDAFTWKNIIWPWPSRQGHTKCCPVPSTSCDLCSYRVWSYYVKSFRRRSIHKKFNIWPLTLGSRSHKMLPSTLYIMWPLQLQGLKLLGLTSYEEIHLQENSIFDLDLGVKVTQNVAQYPLHHVTFSATKFEVATSKGLGGDAFTRNFNIWPLTLGSRSHKMLPSSLYIMWPI